MIGILSRRFALEFNKARQTSIDSSISRFASIGYILIYHLTILSTLNHEGCRTGKGLNQYIRIVVNHFHIQKLSDIFNIPVDIINVVAFGFIMFVSVSLGWEIYTIARCQRKKLLYQPSPFFQFAARHASYILRYVLLVPVLQAGFQMIMQNKLQDASTWDLISGIIAFPNIILILILDLISEYFSFPPAFGDLSLIPRNFFELTVFELTFVLISTAISSAEVLDFKYAQIASYVLLACFVLENLWQINHIRYYRDHLHRSSIILNSAATMYCLSYVVKILNLEGSSLTELPLLLVSPLIYKATFFYFESSLKQAFERLVTTDTAAKKSISALELLAFYAHFESQEDAAFLDTVISILSSKDMLIAHSSLNLNKQSLFGEEDAGISDETPSRLTSLILQDKARRTILDYIDAVFNLKLNDTTYQQYFSMDDLLMYISFLSSVNFQEVQALQLIALTSHKLKKEDAKLSFIQYCQLQSFEETLETTISARRTNKTLSVGDVLAAVRQSLATKKCMREYLDSKLKFLGALLEPKLQMKMLSKTGQQLLEDEEATLAQIAKGTESFESRHIARIFILEILENNERLKFSYKYPFVLKLQKSFELELSHRPIAQLDFKITINSLESTSDHRIDMYVRSNGHQEEGDLKAINEKFLVSIGYSAEDRDKLDFNQIMPGYFPTSKAAYTKGQHESVGIFFAREKQSHLRSFETFRVYEVMNSDVFEVYYMRRDQGSISRYLLLKENGEIIGVSGSLGAVFEETCVLEAINNLEGRSIDDILITDHSSSIMSNYDEKTEDRDHLGYIIPVTERSNKDWISRGKVKGREIRLEVFYRMALLTRDDGVKRFMVTINITRGLTDVKIAENPQKTMQTDMKTSTESGGAENTAAALDMHLLPNQEDLLSPTKLPLDDIMTNHMEEDPKSPQVPAKFLELDIGCDEREESEAGPSEKELRTRVLSVDKLRVQALSADGLRTQVLSGDKPNIPSDTKVDDVSKSGRNAMEKIHKLESSSIHSSRSSSQAQKMKEMRGSLTNVKLPLVLRVLHVFGLLVMASLITLLAADYVIINQKYADLATFSDLATYPSTLVSMMSKFHAYSEFVASIDNYVSGRGLYKREFSREWMPLVRSSIKDTFKDFLTTYMDKAVNLGPEGVFPAFSSNSFTIDLYFGNEAWDRKVSLHEAIEVASAYMQSVADNVNKSLPAKAVDLKFLRQNILNYTVLFDEVSDNLFNQLFTNFDLMSSFLNGIFIAGILLPLTLAILFIFIYHKFEKQEEGIVSVFAKIPNGSILPEIERLTNYKVFFTEALVNTFEYQIRERMDKVFASQVQFSKDKKSRRLQSSKTFVKNSTNCYAMIVILLLYSFVYSAIFIPLFTLQQARTTGMLALLSEKKNFADSYKTFAITHGLWMQTLSYASAADSSKAFEWMNQTAAAYAAANDYQNILNNLFLGSSVIWTSDYISDELKAVLDVLTNGDLCTLATNSTFVAEQCPTVYHGITSRGLLGSYKKYLETTETFRNMLSSDFSSATLLDITRSETFMDDWPLWSVVYSIFDPVLVAFDQNLQEISYESSLQMKIFISVGVVLYVFLYIATWMPILAWIQNRYRISRKLFTILPSAILMKNAYIKNLFKKI